MRWASACTKLNRETKNFMRYASNLRLMETSLYAKLHQTSISKNEVEFLEFQIDFELIVVQFQKTILIKITF